MNYSVRNVALLLSMSLAAASCTQLPHEQSVSAPDPVTGNLIITDKNLGRPCRIPPVAGENEVYRFGKGKFCDELPNDEAYNFRINGLPSAVLITFYDSPDCAADVGNFAFQVRTLQSPTTVGDMLLSTAHAGETGEILNPGLRLEWTEGSGQVGGKLSCVRVEY